MNRIPRLLFFLALVLTCSSASGATGITDVRLDQLTQSVVESEFSWLSGSDMVEATVDGHILDDTTFMPSYLLEVQLTISWRERSVERALAFLFDDPDSWEASYEHRLRTLLRANSGVLLLEEGRSAITDVHDSGYWMAKDAPHDKGTRLWVRDYQGKPIAHVVVEDVFSYVGDDGSSSTVMEMTPLWSDRPLVAGMPLDRRTDISFRIGVPLSLDRVGVDLDLDVPIPSTMFRFSGKIGVERMIDTADYELLVSLGFNRHISLAEFSKRTDDLGSWWTNIQLVAGMYLSAGMSIEPTGSIRFLYGGEGYLGIGHRSTAHWYWALSAGYRYRALLTDNGAIGVQGNEKGITLSPSIGWVW